MKFVTAGADNANLSRSSLSLFSFGVLAGARSAKREDNNNDGRTVTTTTEATSPVVPYLIDFFLQQ